jgi:hypothetical protein
VCRLWWFEFVSSKTWEKEKKGVVVVEEKKRKKMVVVDVVKMKQK